MKVLFNQKYRFEYLAGLLILIGSVLRFRNYFFNRSLWYDEAMLSLNVLKSDYLTLLEPLQMQQAAPVGFLWAQRLAVDLFGSDEFSLRLFPLLAGLISLPLLYTSLRHVSNKKIANIGLAIFCFAPPIVYYATEAKQYSFDILFSLICLVFIFQREDKENSILSGIAMGLIGGIAVWFSHPVAFTLAGIGIFMLFQSFFSNRKKSLLSIVIAIVMWLGSFGIVYFINLESIIQNDYLVNYWKKSFMPFPPLSLADLKWYGVGLLRIAKYCLGYKLIFSTGLASILLLIGVLRFVKRKDVARFAFISPLVVALIVSAFQLYPFVWRFLLYALPGILLAISTALFFVYKKKGIGPYLFWIIMAVILFEPLRYHAVHLFYPVKKEDLKEVLHQVSQRYEKGNKIYIYYGAQPAFEFYQNQYFDAKVSIILGLKQRDNPSNYKHEIEQFRSGEKVWFIFSHVWPLDTHAELEIFQNYLSEKATLESTVMEHGAQAFLYRFK